MEWGGRFGLLHEDHTESDDCALADKIDKICSHGFKDLGGVLQSSACTGGAERHSLQRTWRFSSRSKAVRSAAPNRDS
jgi:hypothetical protein